MPSVLRQSVPKSTQVIYIYDQADIDLRFSLRCQKESAVYFLSRVREGIIFEQLHENDSNALTPRYAGAQADLRVHSINNINRRIITYIEPETYRRFEFLTNVMDLPPGVLVELFRRRWDIEKGRRVSILLLNAR